MSGSNTKKHKKTLQENYKNSAKRILKENATISELLIVVVSAIYYFVSNQNRWSCILAILYLLILGISYLKKDLTKEKSNTALFRYIVSIGVFWAFYSISCLIIPSVIIHGVFLKFIFTIILYVVFWYIERMFIYTQLTYNGNKDILIGLVKQKITKDFQIYNFLGLSATVLAMLFTIKIGYVANQINEKNQQIVFDLNKLNLSDKGDAYYVNIDELGISQGGIKKPL